MKTLIKALEYVSGKIGEIFDCDECALNDHQANHLHDMESVVDKALTEKLNVVNVIHIKTAGGEMDFQNSWLFTGEDAPKKAEAKFTELVTACAGDVGEEMQDMLDDGYFAKGDDFFLLTWPEMEDETESGKECHECGQKFEIDENGIANHINEDGEIDHDKDAEHVPFSLDDETAPSNRVMAADEVINAISEALCRATGEEIEAAAREAGLTGIKYVGDSMFEAD